MCSIDFFSFLEQTRQFVCLSVCRSVSQSNGKQHKKQQRQPFPLQNAFHLAEIDIVSNKVHRDDQSFIDNHFDFTWRSLDENHERRQTLVTRNNTPKQIAIIYQFEWNDWIDRRINQWLWCTRYFGFMQCHSHHSRLTRVLRAECRSKWRSSQAIAQSYSNKNKNNKPKNQPEAANRQSPTFNQTHNIFRFHISLRIYWSITIKLRQMCFDLWLPCCGIRWCERDHKWKNSWMDVCGVVIVTHSHSNTHTHTHTHDTRIGRNMLFITASTERYFTSPKTEVRDYQQHKMSSSLSIYIWAC